MAYYLKLLFKAYKSIIMINLDLLINRKVTITNVIPGDFNSDGHLDALLSYYKTSLTSYEDQTFVKIFLGKDSDEFGMYL